jgi:hypothetical protein
MPHLHIQERTYYSQRDEDHFFAWLEAIPGVTRIVGTPEGLRVTLRSKRLSDFALRDLLALHFRYGLRMTELAQFENPKNTSWFRSPTAYWHKKVFQR